MLLELAIGDAYGSGFEFASDEIIKKEHKLDKYYSSRIDSLEAGDYTDDTQMSIAIIELMLSNEEWTQLNIAKYFLNSFKRDPIHGYSKGFYSFLVKTENEEDFINNIKNDSIRNGAAMRSVPIGLYKDISEVKEKAKSQAMVTHNTKEGIISSQAVALISHYFAYNIGSKKELKTFIEKETLELFKDDFNERVPCKGIETIDAVLTVLKKSSSLKEILDNAIKLGGDTDSVASIAMGVASFSDEFKKELPGFLFNNLRNNKYGKDFILNLDQRILMHFK